MRRPISVLIRGLIAMAMLAALSLGTAAIATAASVGPTTTCSNGVNDTPGLGLICQVTVVNTITQSGGSARVTIRECHGSAGAPTAKCSTRVSLLNKPVSRVRQCNYAINGGGGTLRCSVRVTNNFVLMSPGSRNATVDQCVGSGGGITTGCDPFPATTTNATITQCNGTANGGTLVRLRCTASGTRASAFGVTVNQCNNAANGGGSLVICSANIVNRTVAAGTPTDTAPPTSSDVPAGAAQSSASLAPIGGSFVLALLLILVYTERRRRAIV
jgi:hypothetical protein